MAFGFTRLGPMPAYAQEFTLPLPGVRVHLSPIFNPPMLKGLKVHADNPFRFDFILDQGDSTVIPAKAGIQQHEQLKTEATRLIKYFLTSLTVPENDLWVNLSPYEKDRIIPDAFGKTEMGRDLLAQDYLLKQITASLIYPEEEMGKKFWDEIYKQAQAKYGTTNIPINTFNKVWIVPQKAVVYEGKDTAYVVEAKLKVMLEQDYLAMENNISPPPVGGVRGGSNDVNKFGSQIVRDIVLPQLEKEVNMAKNFAQLRQVYNSLILAAWYKKKIKDSILSQVYADKAKVVGLSFPKSSIGNPAAIYQQYLTAFKKGVFNYIKEESAVIPERFNRESTTGTTIPRKYFSGGFAMTVMPMITATTDAAQLPHDNSLSKRISVDLAMTNDSIVNEVNGSKKFEDLVEMFRLDVVKVFEGTADDLQVRVELLKEHNNTINMIAGREAGDVTSHNIVVSGRKGVVAQIHLFDGRSLGRNTLGVARLLIQDPPGDAIIITKRDDVFKTQDWVAGIGILRKLLEDNGASSSFNEEDLISIAKASVGLTREEIQGSIQAAQPFEGKIIKERFVEELLNKERKLYPTQRLPSLNNSAHIFNNLFLKLKNLVQLFHYESISATVSFPYDAQNFILYQRMKFKPIVPKQQEDVFKERVLSILYARDGSSLKAKAWQLSRTMTERLTILMEYSINGRGSPQGAPAETLTPSRAQLSQRTIKRLMQEDLKGLLGLLSHEDYQLRRWVSLRIRSLGMKEPMSFAEKLIENFNDPELKELNYLNGRLMARIESLHALRMLLENKTAQDIKLFQHILKRLENGALLWLQAAGVGANDSIVTNGAPWEIDLIKRSHGLHLSAEIQYPNAIDSAENKADLDFFENIRLFLIDGMTEENNIENSREIERLLRDLLKGAMPDSLAKRLTTFSRAQAIVPTSRASDSAMAPEQKLIQEGLITEIHNMIKDRASNGKVYVTTRDARNVGLVNFNDLLSYLRLGFHVDESVVQKDSSGRQLRPFHTVVARKNAAMSVLGEKGGIDLTAGKMLLEVKNKIASSFAKASADWSADMLSPAAFHNDEEEFRFNIDPAMLAQWQNASGVVSTIIKIEPLGDLRMFLGVNQDDVVLSNNHV